MIDYSTCELCKKGDTVEQYIYMNAPMQKKLWLSIFAWWKTAFECSIPITIMEIIVGVPNEQSHYNIQHLQNSITLTYIADIIV